MYPKKIPVLPEPELWARFSRVRPMMRFAKSDKGLAPSELGELHFILVESPHETYTVEPRTGNRVLKIKKLAELQTLHYWTSIVPAIKPTCAEVLAQIPPEILHRAVAFEVKITVDTSNIDGDYIRTTTVLYERLKRR